MSYQKTTGTLNPGGHPGSYNGQDAYSDLLVTEEYERSYLYRERSNEPSARNHSWKPQLYARPTGGILPNDSVLRGGVKRHRPWTVTITVAQEQETARSVRFWQRKLSA